MEIERNFYVSQLLSKRNNGLVKIITGPRRVGKSYLLSHLYKNALLLDGVSPTNILQIELDKKKYVAYRNPDVLYTKVLDFAKNGNEKYYIFIDEVQMAYRVKNSDVDENSVPVEDQEMLYTTVYDVLNDLREQPNLDVYVTGSNSKMLSSDILTSFRDRGTVINVFPLSFAEYFPYSNKEKSDAWQEYMRYGGMPLAVLESDENEKQKYLKGLYKKVYLKDIVERYHLTDDGVLSQIVNTLCSSVGSLTNPHNLANTIQSKWHYSVADKTIKKYIDYLEDAFLFNEANRYDIKGKRYFSFPLKYYSTDVGLRNAQLNFRQIDEGYLQENVIYNDLLRRGYAVDVGMVEITKVVNGKAVQSQHEIDFIVNTNRGKVYIQSAENIDSEELQQREALSLKNTGDFFRKIIILGGNQKAWIDENGIEYVGIIPFLLEELHL